jgi:CYTH domain-containing protein
MADAVHAALVEAGWPPRHATMITGAVTYLVIGAASTPSGTGFDLGLAALVRGLEDVFAEAVEWRRAPGEGRYARTERERRFLVRRLPPDLGRPRRIEDRYLDGTRLRLRHVREGEESVFKLTQKVRRAGGPADVAITNTYLTAEEHRTLSLLPGAPLAKSRYEWRSGAHVFVVDEFHGRLEGLWLAEVEVAALDAALTLPEWAGREVSHDDRFSGGHLATADAAECAEIVRLARSDAG